MKRKSTRVYTLKDKTNQKIGRLTVLRPERRGNRTYWLCKCECGTEKWIRGDSLKFTQSCGCLLLESLSQTPHGLSHGLSRTRIWSIWRNMLRRCLSPNHHSYQHYGGRGITVCKRWKTSVKLFFDDVGHPPSSKHTFDRIDNDGHYSCGHCPECTENGWTNNHRWATQSEQMNNTRQNVLLTFNNKTQTLMQWSRETSLPYSCLRKRLALNWTPEQMLTTPVHSKKRGGEPPH